MKIGTYISQLLFEQDQVILPGLGEFSTRYIPARFIPEEKKIESPSKVVTFNADKKDGDTPLVQLMAEREGKSPEKIKEFIEKFVAEVNSSLSAGQKVKLDQIGIFSSGAEGNVVFEPDRSINYLSDVVGLGSISEPLKSSKPKEKPTPEPKLKPEPVPEPLTEPEPVPLPEPEPDNSISSFEENIPGEPTTRPLEQPNLNATMTEPERTPEYSDYDEEQEVEDRQLPAAIKWLAWVIIPFLIILIILAFNWNFIFGKKRQAPETKAPTELVAPAVEAPQANETVVPEETEAVNQEVKPAEKPAPATGVIGQPEAGRKAYYIVVGAFQDAAEANRYVEELKGKGAGQARVFMQTSTGFHRVSYAFYYDLAEAEAQLPRIKQEINASAWILHR